MYDILFRELHVELPFTTFEGRYSRIEGSDVPIIVTDPNLINSTMGSQSSYMVDAIRDATINQILS